MTNSLHETSKLIPYRHGDYWGYSNEVEELLIPCVFEFVLPFDEHHNATVEMSGKWGLLNYKGQLVIPCIYCFPLKFSEGFAVASVDGNRYAYLERTGKLLTDFVFEKALDFVDRFAIVSIEGEWGVINNKAEIVIPLKYDEINAFNKTSFLFKIDNLWGICDINGNNLTEPVYERIETLKEGLAIARVEYELEYPDEDFYDTEIRSGFINESGTEIIGCKFEYVLHFQEGLGAVWERRKPLPKWSFIRRDESRPFAKTFDDVNHFVDGRCIVEHEGKWGIIDKVGEWIVPPKHNHINPKSYDRYFCATISDDSSELKWDCYDSKGELLFSLSNISFVGQFHDGLAVAKKNELYGYIDIFGRQVIPYYYESAGDFVDGLAIVKLNKWGLINHFETPITPFKYDKIIRLANGLFEVREWHGGYSALYDDKFYHPKFYSSEHLTEDSRYEEILHEPVLGYLNKDGKEFFRDS